VGVEDGTPYTAAVTTSLGTEVGTRSWTALVLRVVGADVTFSPIKEVTANVGAKVKVDGGRDLNASVMTSVGTKVGTEATTEETDAAGTAEGTRSETADVLKSLGADVGRLALITSVRREVGVADKAGGKDLSASVIDSVGTADGTPTTILDINSDGIDVGTRSITAAVRISEGAAVGACKTLLGVLTETVGAAKGITDGAKVDRRSSTAEVKTAVGAIVASAGRVLRDSVMSSEGTDVGSP